MDSENLVEEREVAVTSFDDALSVIGTDYVAEKIGANLSQLSVEEDGQLHWEGGDLPMMQSAFDSLCGLAEISTKAALTVSERVPMPFGERCFEWS